MIGFCVIVEYGLHLSDYVDHGLLPDLVYSGIGREIGGLLRLLHHMLLLLLHLHQILLLNIIRLLLLLLLLIIHLLVVVHLRVHLLHRVHLIHPTVRSQFMVSMGEHAIRLILAKSLLEV